MENGEWRMKTGKEKIRREVEQKYRTEYVNRRGKAAGIWEIQGRSEKRKGEGRDQHQPARGRKSRPCGYLGTR